MVQVHVTPPGGECCSERFEHLRLGPEGWPGDDPPELPSAGLREAAQDGIVGRLPGTLGLGLITRKPAETCAGWAAW